MPIRRFFIYLSLEIFHGMAAFTKGEENKIIFKNPSHLLFSKPTLFNFSSLPEGFFIKTIFKSALYLKGKRK